MSSPAPGHDLPVEFALTVPVDDLRTPLVAPEWGTPLRQKMADDLPGQAVGPLTTLAVSNVAQSLPRHPQAVSATLQVQAQPVRYTADGTVPTASVGFRADAGTILRVTGVDDLLGFQLIREGAADATVVVQLFT